MDSAHQHSPPGSCPSQGALDDTATAPQLNGTEHYKCSYEAVGFAVVLRGLGRYGNLPVHVAAGTYPAGASCCGRACRDGACRSAGSDRRRHEPIPVNCTPGERKSLSCCQVHLTRSSATNAIPWRTILSVETPGPRVRTREAPDQRSPEEQLTQAEQPICRLEPWKRGSPPPAGRYGLNSFIAGSGRSSKSISPRAKLASARAGWGLRLARRTVPRSPRGFAAALPWALLFGPPRPRRPPRPGRRP